MKVNRKPLLHVSSTTACAYLACKRCRVSSSSTAGAWSYGAIAVESLKHNEGE